MCRCSQFDRHLRKRYSSREATPLCHTPILKCGAADTGKLQRAQRFFRQRIDSRVTPHRRSMSINRTSLCTCYRAKLPAGLHDSQETQPMSKPAKQTIHRTIPMRTGRRSYAIAHPRWLARRANVRIKPYLGKARHVVSADVCWCSGLFLIYIFSRSWVRSKR